MTMTTTTVRTAALRLTRKANLLVDVDGEQPFDVIRPLPSPNL